MKKRSILLLIALIIGIGYSENTQQPRVYQRGSYEKGPAGSPKICICMNYSVIHSATCALGAKAHN